MENRGEETLRDPAEKCSRITTDERKEKWNVRSNHRASKQRFFLTVTVHQVRSSSIGSTNLSIASQKESTSSELRKHELETPRKSTPVLPRSVVTILSEEMIETPTRKMDESVTSAAHGTDRMPQVCAEYGTRLERRNVVSFSPSLDARCSGGSRGREEHAWFAA